MSSMHLSLSLNEITPKNIAFSLICLFAFLLPFNTTLSSVCWILAVVVNYKNTIVASRTIPIFLKIMVALFIAYWLMDAVSIFRSENNLLAINKLVQHCSFSILPLVLFSVISNQKHVKYVFMSLLFGTLASAFFCLAMGFYKLLTHQISHINYSEFSVLMHPSYFAVHLSFSSIFLLNILFNDTKIKWWYFIAFLILQVSLILCASRAGYLANWIGLLIFISFADSLNKYIKIGVVILMFLLPALVIGLAQQPIFSIYLRLNEFFPTKETFSESRTKSYQEHLLLQKAAFEAIKSRPITGYGTSEVEVVIANHAKKIGLPLDIHKRYNAHNQFLQCWLASGLIQLIILIGLFLLPLLGYKRSGAKYMFGLLIMILTHFIFESMLERQVGIYIFVLTLPVMCIHEVNEKKGVA